jgi:hypothetical protein
LEEALEAATKDEQLRGKYEFAVPLLAWTVQNTLSFVRSTTNMTKATEAHGLVAGRLTRDSYPRREYQKSHEHDCMLFGYGPVVSAG